MSDMRLKVVLTGDGRQLAGSLKTAQSEVQQFGQTSVQAGAASTQAFSKTRVGVESISTQLQAARQQLLTFIGVHQTLNAGRQMVQTVAAYQDAQTQLKGLTATAADYAEQEQYLIDLGDRHHKNILTLTSSYSRLLTLQNAGLMTQAEGRDILEGLSNAASQLGASNAQLEQSMYGLAQGLSSGILRAEELNQVTEPLPGLLQELDKAADLGAGGFRQLVNAGEVTSAMFRDTLITALAAYDGAAERTASNLTAKFTDVQNSYLLLARELQQPLTDGLGPLLDGISASLKWTAENSETLGAVLQGAIVVGAGRATVAIGSMASAKMADLTVSRQSAISELELERRRDASAAAAVRASAQHAAAEVRAYQLVVESTRAEITREQVRLRAQISAEGRRQAVNRLAVASGELAAATSALSRVEAQYATATKQVTVAESAAAASAAKLRAARLGVGSATSGLLGLLGGPVGLVVTAGLTAAAFIDWGGSAAHAADGTNALTRSVDELTAAQARQRINNLKDDYDAAQKQVQRFERQLQELAEQYPNMYPSERNMREFDRALDDARGNLDSAKQAAAGYSNQIKELEDHIEALNNTAKTPVNTPLQVDPDQEKAIARITDQLIEQYMQLQLGERAYLDYQLAQQNATAGQRAQALAAFDASKALKEKIKADEAADAAATAHATSVKDFADSVLDALDPLREIEQQMGMVWAAFDAGHLDDSQVADYVDHLIKKFKELDDVKVDPLKNAGKGMGEMAAGINSIAGAMQGMYEEGDRGYRNMAVAMQAANVIAAVGAVLTQGMGDPYTAFARMAAMAAAVAALGYSVGNIGGGAPDDAARRQAQQGTGTVLGDTAAKSESIAAAVEINASATQQLVGINRDQLRALQAMQAGISGAAVRIARGSMGVDYDYGGGRTAIATPKGIFDHGDMAMDGINGFVQRIGTTLSENLGKMNLVSLLDPLSRGLVNGVAGLVGKMSDAGVLGDPISKMYTKGVSKVLGGESKVTDRGVELIGGTMAEMMEETLVRGYETTRHRKYRWRDWSESTGYFDFEVDPNDPGRADPGVQFREVFEKLADSVYEGAIALGLAGDEVAASINNFVIETQKISLKDLTAEEQAAEIEAVFSSIFDNLAGTAVEFLQNPGFQKAGEGLAETLARVATNVQVTEEAVFRLGFAAENINPEQFARLSEYLIEASAGLEQFIGAMSSFVDKFAPESHKLDLLAADMERSLAAVGLSVPETRDEMWQLMQTLDATTEAGADQIATLLRVGDTADAYYKMLEQAGMRLQALLGADSDALTGYLQNLADWSASELSRIEQDYRERIALAEQQLRIGRELRQYVEQLRISELSPYDPGEKLELATEQFAALLVRAEQGDMEAARMLQSSAQTYLQNADAYYGRSDPYLTIFEEVTRSLDRLGLDIMGGLDDNSIERLNQQMLAEQQRIRDYAQQQLNWVVAQYDALTSIEQLLELLPGSLASQLRSITNPGTAASATEALLLSQWEKMGGGAYAQTDLSRYAAGIDSGTVDKSAINNDLAYYQQNQSAAMQQVLDLWNGTGGGNYNDADLADYAARIASGNATLSTEDLDYYRRTRINGSHKTGLRSVPFDGYVAELHKDERVLTERESAEYNSFDSGAIVSELAALRQEFAQLRAERARDAEKAEQQRNQQTDATEALIRVNRAPVKMT